MLLAEPEKYRDTINVIKKVFAHVSIELKKNLSKKNYLMYKTQMAFIMKVNLKD